MQPELSGAHFFVLQKLGKKNSGNGARIKLPKSTNLKILELEAPQIPTVLEDKDSPYANLIVSREDNKNDEKVKKFVQAYQSPEVESAAKQTFKGGAVKAW